MTDATTYGKACNRGDFWPNKKCKTMPWAGEPTPLTDAAWTVDDNHDPFENDVARIATSLYLERRMRAAERLLESKMCRRECGCCKEAKAHLEAARKEDWK